MKSAGDGVVTGYVRHKKVKECRDYKEACRHADRTLSRIKGGRPLENDKYAAVIGFRWLFLLLFFLALFLLLLLMWMYFFKPAKADERETQATAEAETTSATEVETFIPDETIVVTKPCYEDLYITIPGMTEAELSENNQELLLFNPEENGCLLLYELYIEGRQVASTDKLKPGEAQAVNFYEHLTSGIYEVECVATGYSSDGETRYNSGTQNIRLTVY